MELTALHWSSGHGQDIGGCWVQWFQVVPCACLGGLFGLFGLCGLVCFKQAEYKAESESAIVFGVKMSNGGVYNWIFFSIATLRLLVVPFDHFWGEGSPTKMDYRQNRVPLFYPLYWRT